MSKVITFIVFWSAILVGYIMLPKFEYPIEVGASNNIDKAILKLFAKHEMGGAYLISQGGEIKHEKYAGYEDYFSKTMLTEKSIFNLGTLSQQYLGNIYYDLIDNEIISPDYKVSLYVDELRGRMVGEQTIRDLMVMNSRLPFNFNRGRIIKWQIAIEPTWEELRAQLVKVTPAIKCPDYVPKGCYSKLSYTALGIILEQLSKKSYDQIFQEKIVDQFDLQDTRYNLLESDEMVQGHYLIAGKLAFAPVWDHKYSVGNSGVRATLRDLHKFQLAITDQMNALENPSKYFDLANFLFGWRKEKVEDSWVFWHKGEDVGFYSLVVRDPSKEFIGIFLFNIDIRKKETFHKELLNTILKLLPKFNTNITGLKEL